jgi:hypothetical protein
MFSKNGLSSKLTSFKMGGYPEKIQLLHHYCRKPLWRQVKVSNNQCHYKSTNCIQRRTWSVRNFRTCSLCFVSTVDFWVVSLPTPPHPQPGGPPLIGNPRLLIHCICSYSLNLEAVSSIGKLRTRHAVVTQRTVDEANKHLKYYTAYRHTFNFN